uniref:Uncharacterized protein n=1 Tax=Arundo donax TaxID=35708 RepID=A0A0A9AV04_ARUDO
MNASYVAMIISP